MRAARGGIAHELLLLYHGLQSNSRFFRNFASPSRRRRVRLREAQHHWAQAHIIAKHIICANGATSFICVRLTAE